MKASSDKHHAKYRNDSFSDAKAVAETPHLARLQKLAGGKSRITIRIDSDVLAIFKAQADAAGGSYQTLMNEALRQFAQGTQLVDVVRTSVRESVAEYLVGKSVPRPPRKTAKRA